MTCALYLHAHFNSCPSSSHSSTKSLQVSYPPLFTFLDLSNSASSLVSSGLLTNKFKMSDKEHSSSKPDTNTAAGAQAIGGAISSDVANTGTTKKLATQDNSVVGGKSCERILQPFIFFLIARLTARYPGISFGQSMCRYPYTFGFYFCAWWQSLVAHEVLLWWQGFHAAVQLRCGAISPRAS